MGNNRKHKQQQIRVANNNIAKNYNNFKNNNLSKTKTTH